MVSIATISRSKVFGPFSIGELPDCAGNVADGGLGPVAAGDDLVGQPIDRLRCLGLDLEAGLDPGVELVGRVVGKRNLRSHCRAPLLPAQADQ